MSDNNPQAGEIERWRKNLLEAEAELHHKTLEWADTQEFFLSTISKLARLADNGDSNISSEINQLKVFVEKPDELVHLKQSVEQLMKKLMDQSIGENTTENRYSHGNEVGILLDKLAAASGVSEKVLAIKSRIHQVRSEAELSTVLDELVDVWVATEQTGTIDPSKFCAMLVAEILYQLLEKINLPADLSQRLNKLKKQLEAGVETSSWAAMLSEIADMASAVQLKINHERLDIEVFLKQVTGRLQELDTFFVGTQEHRKQSWLNGQAFGDAVKNEMRTLVKGADEAADINVLKVQIQRRLAAIEEHLNGYHATESEREKVVTSDVENLKKRLVELEAESQRLKDKVQQERLQAQTDILTGVPNRLGYENRMAQEFARWKRFQNSLMLVICDVDLFKRINDGYGHAAGDKALKTIAKILSKNIRETDYLARYGGEEFVLIMPGASLEIAKMLGEKLRGAIEKSGFHFKGEPLTITMSFGIAEFRQDDVPLKVFERADAALYRAKESGRNRVEIAD